MNKFYTFLAAILLTTSTFAQAPEKMSYQAVIRNSSDALVANQAVGMRISILQTTATGTAVYVETQTPTTNINGLVSLEIGAGTPVTGTFAGINWATGPYFIKTETDPTGGTAYAIVGTNELMSVPYALFSANAGVGGFAHYLGEVFNGGIIFYLYRGSDGLEHGLIAALTESSQWWQTTSANVNANRSEDGAYNTSLMTNSPAASYVTGLGVGWYVPSIDELRLLSNNRFIVNKTARAGGYTLLNTLSDYWSSTEADATRAFYVSFFDNYPGYTFSPKESPSRIRAVRAF